MPVKLVYLANDVFSKGGIQRYSSAQITALRSQLQDENLLINSLCPPRENAFETDFQVDYHGQGLSLIQKIRFSVIFLVKLALARPTAIWSNHIRLLPLVFLGKILAPQAQVILNIYGLEMWSGFRRIDLWLFQKVDRIISDSHFTAQYVVDHYHIPPERIVVIWDPVDVTRFAPKRVQYQELQERYHIPDFQDAFCLMTLGRISITSRHKGYDRLIDLMTNLHDQNIHLLICGDGNDRHRLEKRVKEEGLVGRVHFTGSIPENDLVDIYQLGDVFILISERGRNMGEGVPLTPLEAAACGKPIIVGDEDGSQEAVQDGINGYIVSPKDPNTLKERVLELYKNEELRKEMGKSARQIIEEDFSFQRFSKQVLNILNTLP